MPITARLRTWPRPSVTARSATPPLGTTGGGADPPAALTVAVDRDDDVELRPVAAAVPPGPPAGLGVDAAGVEPADGPGLGG